MTTLPDMGEGFDNLAGFAAIATDEQARAEQWTKSALVLDRRGFKERAEAVAIAAACSYAAAAAARDVADNLDPNATPTDDDVRRAELAVLLLRATSRALDHVTTLAEETPDGAV